MSKISWNEFDTAYQSIVDEVWPLWSDQMQTEIARHCVAWSPGRIDFLNYLRLSAVRFYKSYEALSESGGNSICDVGGFWGVWPMTANKLGFEVAMTETLRFYGESFTHLFDYIRKSGVTIYDYDPFLADAVLPRKFDFVSAMAVIEHYPHSLKTLVANLKRMASPGGRIYLEAPNIAYWPKRTAMLRGRTPLVPIADIYHSEEPFIGHHHEMTLTEMRELAALSDMTVIRENLYNYSQDEHGSVRMFVRHPIMSLVFKLLPESRECVAVLCEPLSQNDRDN